MEKTSVALSAPVVKKLWTTDDTDETQMPDYQNEPPG